MAALIWLVKVRSESIKTPRFWTRVEVFTNTNSLLFVAKYNNFSDLYLFEEHSDPHPIIYLL